MNFPREIQVNTSVNPPSMGPVNILHCFTPSAVQAGMKKLVILVLTAMIEIRSFSNASQDSSVSLSYA